MTAKQQLLDELVEQNNGCLKTSDALSCGISRSSLMAYVKSHNMSRAAHGIYLSPDAWTDELYIISLKNKQTCFSHETALFLHGLTEHEPSSVTVTAKNGYNASHLSKKGIHVRKVKPQYYPLGISETATPFGNMVRVYDRERTICDIIKTKDKLDVQVFRSAIREYMGGTAKNPARLMRYAEILGIESKVRTYTEVML